MLRDSIKKSFEKALDMFGQDILIFNDYKDNYYNRANAIAKYDRQVIESDNLTSTLADRYKFTTFTLIETNNYIAYKGHFYKILSVDDTREDIYTAYAEYSAIKVPVFTLSVDSNINIKIGDEVNLNVKTYRDSTLIESPEINYSSSNENIATVDKSGNVNGIRSGKCEIIVKFNEIITVINVDVAEKVYTLELNTYSLELNKDDTYKIVATCNVDGVLDESPILSYRSNNDTIATIDNEGNITAISEGSCIIIVTYNNVEKEINIVVNEIIEPVEPVYSISSSLGTFDIRRYSASTFTVLKDGIADTESWDITVDYNGVDTAHIKLEGTTSNSIKIRNSKGANTKKLILNFVNGDITIKQEVGLTK